MAAKKEIPSIQGYINHHLSDMTIGEGFMAVNVGVHSVSRLFLVSSLSSALWLLAAKATTGVPGKFQCFCGK